MKWLKYIWNTFKYGFLLFGLMVIIGFASSKRSERFINEVQVHIDDQYQNYFIDQTDVLNLMNAEGKDYMLNSDIGQINLKELELRIEAHQFVEDAQAYLDLHGNLMIEVMQNRPLVRVINRGGEDLYIGTKGDVLPESQHYTSRVMLVEFEGARDFDQNINETDSGQKLFELMQTIDQDEFWKAQIAGMTIKKNGEVVLQPQITKQLVYLGQPENIENKFRKLKTFYTEILPYKGWNTYKTVNLKYKNQIVCK